MGCGREAAEGCTVFFVYLIGLVSAILAFVAEYKAAKAGRDDKYLSVEDCKHLRGPASNIGYAAAATHLSAKILGFLLLCLYLLSRRIFYFMLFSLASWGVGAMAYFLLLAKAAEPNDFESHTHALPPANPGDASPSPLMGDPLIKCLAPKRFYFAGSGILFLVALQLELYALTDRLFCVCDCQIEHELEV